MPDLAPWEQEEQERWKTRAQETGVVAEPVVVRCTLSESPKPSSSPYRCLFYLLLPLLLFIPLLVWFFFSWRGTSTADAPQQQKAESNSQHPGWITPTGTRFTPIEILERSSSSIVAIYAENHDETASSGTGFFIDGGGHVLTNFHVVEGSGHIVIRMKDDKSYPVIRIVAQSPEWDLALLEVNMPIEDSIPLNIAAGLPPLSSDVSVVGTPRGMPHILSTGALTAVKGTHLEMIQISAPISVGFSGSPVFNDRGSVIGIATHGTVTEGKSIGLGASSLVITRFLKEKPFLKKDSLPLFDTQQGFLPDGGYRAYTIAPMQSVRADHSSRSDIVAVLQKKSKVKVKREWVEMDRHAARLTKDMIVKVSGKDDIRFRAGEAVHIINPDISGSGILVLVWYYGEEFQIVLDEGEIDRLYQKTWCQVILPSGEVGWLLKHELKI